MLVTVAWYDSQIVFLISYPDLGKTHLRECLSLQSKHSQPGHRFPLKQVERRRKRENSLCAGSLVDQLHVVQNCGTKAVASDQALQTRCPIPSLCGGGGGGLGRSGKSLLIERRCGEWASPSKDSQVFLFLTLWVYPTSERSPRGVAFPLGEEMGIYQGSPSSTCVRPLPFSEGSLGNSVDFVPESSEMGQNRTLFKCTTMQHCNQDL